MGSWLSTVCCITKSTVLKCDLKHNAGQQNCFKNLTSVLTVTVWANKDVLAHKDQQRPLQFGTGSVKQWTKCGGVPHVQLVRMSRQNIADTQKRLKYRNGSKLEKKSKHELIFPIHPVPAPGHCGQSGRDSRGPSRRRDAAGASGPWLSPKTQTKKSQVQCH